MKNNFDTPLYEVDERVLNLSNYHPEKVLVVKRIIHKNIIDTLIEVHGLIPDLDYDEYGNYWYVLEKPDRSYFRDQTIIGELLELPRNQEVYGVKNIGSTVKNQITLNYDK